MGKSGLMACVASAISAAIAGISCEQAVTILQRVDPWTRHTIDDSLSGADGIKLGDLNQDGLEDVVVPWEGSGAVVVYLNPGTQQVEQNWPQVRVGRVASVEDAVFVDLDGNGNLDVVSCAEGDVRAIFAHWSPEDAERVLDPAAWITEALPAAEGVQQWMFAVPADIDGRDGIDLVAGGKGDEARIGWFSAPPNPRDLSAWQWHPIADARWTMSLIAVDMDEDGDLDVVATDRKGPDRGTWWFENPTSDVARVGPWAAHLIGSDDREVMFADIADLDGDGLLDVVTAISGKHLNLYLGRDSGLLAWSSSAIVIPDAAGTGKGVRIGDIDVDGQADLVFSCEGAGERYGVAWMSYRFTARDPVWDLGAISGLRGSKYDLVQLYDLDGDGDLDVLTTEESAGLGAVWYENPR